MIRTYIFIGRIKCRVLQLSLILMVGAWVLFPIGSSGREHGILWGGRMSCLWLQALGCGGTSKRYFGC
jgi:hypothetical protein